MAQLVKNLPAVWETWVQSLGWEDPLEKGKATHSSILAWRAAFTLLHFTSLQRYPYWSLFDINIFYYNLLTTCKLMTYTVQSLRYHPVINVKGWVCIHISITFFQSVFLLYLLFGFPYPNWFSLESITMGAKDWAGLVNKALMPKTMEERGDLEQKKVA